ncbi:IS110 family transposase [Lactococcus lactis]|uniref:IS110 family transposase n=2 Tax=Lactococcus lactis TaxID=1358 RepID=UPI0021AE88C5|nr:IS110 family transposase [Lactococcus lactis]MCT1179042.1 IS110 family transposase [Lactococcus lactis]MCT1179289.1 IS110 family transposase [Lactococcus lactis]MCT1180693.1 IS110 family transposase [Lactococcus lactis]MCT1195576.1 IS110 family transposase [Lactococcus lactis]
MTLFVGIDVSKYKHDLAILDEHGEILSKHFRFANTYQGFQKLKEHLETLELPTSELRIALEDTGHYADNLIAFLQNIGYPTFTYNPLIIKEFVKSLTLRKSKTDKKDALSIARKLLADPTPERYTVEPQLQELKELTRYQNRLIHERSKNKTLYVRTLDIVFPEFAKIVKNVHNQFVYDLLSKYPSPQKIKRAHFQSLLTIKRLTADKIKQIQEAAHLTIGNSSLALQLELTQLIDMIRIQTIQINKVQEQINHLMTEIDSPITSITGIGQRLGAIILAEIKNIHNFKTPSQLQAFAGLEPSIYQSGTMDITGHMVKRGSSYLRYALIQAAKLIANYSPHFRAYLRLKISQGKHYNVAVSHVAKKLIRIVYYLLKTNQSFDESKLR